MLGFVYYFTLATLPIVWVATSSFPRWLHRSDRPLNGATLALCYLLPNLFVWACALGVLGRVDSFVFSAWTSVRSCEELLGEQLGGCRFYEQCFVDNISAIFLAVAAAALWLRIDRPTWLRWAVFVFLYWVLMEENDYKPFSILAVDTSTPFSLHAQAHSINFVLANTANFGVPLFILTQAALALAMKKSPTRTEEYLKRYRVLGWLRSISFIHGLGIYLSILSTHFLLNYFSTEHDKYRDFDQLMLYVALVLVSFEFPVRKTQARGASWLAPLLVVGASVVVYLVRSLVLP